MATSTVTAPFQTVRDLLDFLGVSARRVRFTPTPGTATEADLIALNERKQGLYELIDGVLVEKAMGFLESRITVVLIRLLEDWCEARDGGLVMGPDTMMRVIARRVRLPDISIVGLDQLPNRTIPDELVPDLRPDLAIEVISKGNTRREMRLKREDYFGSGTQLVWEIDPRRNRITVYTSPEAASVRGADDPIDGGEVLPGFRFTLQELVARAERRFRRRK